MDRPLAAGSDDPDTLQCLFWQRSRESRAEPLYFVAKLYQPACNFKSYSLRSAGAWIARTTPVEDKYPQGQASDVTPAATSGSGSATVSSSRRCW
jgi:hypothetical protein